MDVIVACEESQIVCKAFRERGHNSYSCDIEPCSGGHLEWHIQDDVLNHLDDGWDLMIAHPPCTHLSVSGAWGFPKKIENGQQSSALEFVRNLMDAPIRKIAIENPVSVIASAIRPSDQTIQPYYFGDSIPKTVCLWLKNLPKLIYALEDTLFEKKTAVEPEYVVYNSKKTKSGKSRYSALHGPLGPNIKDRGKIRSSFFPGIAKAMAEQWGILPTI